MSNKNILINEIMTKFNNNKLLSPVLEDILKGLDITNLNGILKIFTDIKFEALNGADNELFKAINKIKEIPELAEQININNLEKQLVRLQLNVLLSHCRETNSDLLKPLIEALDNKVGALNQIIESKQNIKTQKLSLVEKLVDTTVKKQNERPKFNLKEAMAKLEKKEPMAKLEKKEPDIVNDLKPLSKSTTNIQLENYEQILKPIKEKRKFTTLTQVMKNTKKSAGDYMYIAYEYLRKYRFAKTDAEKLVARLNYNTNMENYKRQKKIEEERKDTGQKGGFNDPYYQKYLKYKSKYLSLNPQL